MFLRFDSRTILSLKKSYKTILLETLSPRRCLDLVLKLLPGGVLKNFAKFTVKHLSQSLCFDKVAGFPYFLDKSLKMDKHC